MPINLQKVPWLLKNTGKIQKAFGVLMIITAIGIFLQVDRHFQTAVLSAFPNYGIGLTQFEDTAAVKQELAKVSPKKMDEQMLGKPLQEINQSKGPPAPELQVGGEWLNTQPLQLAELKGKVVLVDFWTYSCINCQRTLPYLRLWYEKYKDSGLVIIGVHSPEFEFEKDVENVQNAIKDFDIRYPVMQDNQFQTWSAYRNRYWPAKYLIDKDGSIRYTHFGEGEYDETERMIQKLLEEAGSSVSTTSINNPSYNVFSRTPELYLGSGRIEYLVSPEKVTANSLVTFSSPLRLPPNTFAFTGDWLLMPEYAAPSKNAKLILNFDAKEVFLVARPKGEQVGQLKVTLDGTIEALGDDNNNGVVTIDSDRLYKLIRLPDAGRHEIKIEFLDNNLEIYAFTFG
jgi:thiol-disulfide isomerase/thioredoxin